MQKTFMISFIGPVPKDTGNHLAIGAEGLQKAVSAHLGEQLTSDSRERMRILLEENLENIMGIADGRNAVSIYGKHTLSRVDVFVISKTYQ